MGWICTEGSETLFKTHDTVYVTTEFGVRTGYYFDVSRFDASTVAVYAFTYPTMALGSPSLAYSIRYEFTMTEQDSITYLNQSSQRELKTRLFEFVRSRKTIPSLLDELRPAYWNFDFWDSYYLSLISCWTDSYALSKILARKANWLLTRVDSQSDEVAEIASDLSSLIYQNGPSLKKVLAVRALNELKVEMKKVNRERKRGRL